MSILIHGMKMPKDGCKSCAFDIYGSCLIRANMDKPYEVTHSCPLIELPPHGRLGDLDALRRAMYHEAFETDSPMQKWDSGCWIRYKLFERMEEAAPTIIPAEGGDAE